MMLASLGIIKGQETNKKRKKKSCAASTLSTGADVLFLPLFLLLLITGQRGRLSEPTGRAGRRIYRRDRLPARNRGVAEDDNAE